MGGKDVGLWLIHHLLKKEPEYNNWCLVKKGSLIRGAVTVVCGKHCMVWVLGTNFGLLFYWSNFTECRNLQQQPHLHPKYSWDGRVLRRKGKAVVRQNIWFRKTFFDLFHGGSLGGYSGVQVTRSRISSLLYWNGLSNMSKSGWSNVSSFKGVNMIPLIIGATATFTDSHTCISRCQYELHWKVASL